MEISGLKLKRALAKVEVPAEGTEERNFWLEAAGQHGFSQSDEGGPYTVSEDDLLDLIAAAREQGRCDVLGLSSGGDSE